MLKRRLKLLGKLLLVLVVLFAVFLLFERFRGQVSVARYKHQLAANGESLAVQQLIAPPVADAENGAAEILRLKPLFKEGKVLPTGYPPKMRLMTSGRALIGFREDSWVDEKITNTWTEVASDLATNRQALSELCAALAKPGFDFKLDHSRGFEMKLIHLAPLRSYSQWLGVAVQNSLRSGEYPVALEELLTALRIPQALENDRLVISELVRIAIAALNLGTTWEAWQADGWTEDELRQLQVAWEKNTFATNMIRALRVERADGDTYFERFRKSNDETYEYMFPTWLETLTGQEEEQVHHWWQSEFLRKQIYCRLWRFAWLDQDEKFYLEGMQKLIEERGTGADLAGSPVEEYWFGLGKAPHQNFYDDWRFSMSAQSLATLQRARVKSFRAETQRSISLCALALKRYALRHGSFPGTLSGLVPEFLSIIPTDYMDGRPVKYHRNADGSFTLYSVGQDGKDDGGDSSLLEGVKTRDLWRRRDYVWPAPATPEEVAEYRRSSGAN